VYSFITNKTLIAIDNNKGLYFCATSCICCILSVQTEFWRWWCNDL